MCVGCHVYITWGPNNTPKIQAQQLGGNQGRPTWLRVFTEVLNKLRVTANEAVSPLFVFSEVGSWTVCYSPDIFQSREVQQTRQLAKWISFPRRKILVAPEKAQQKRASGGSQAKTANKTPNQKLENHCLKPNNTFLSSSLSNTLFWHTQTLVQEPALQRSQTAEERFPTHWAWPRVVRPGWPGLICNI